MLEIFLKRDSFNWVDWGVWGEGTKAEAEATEAAARIAETFMVGLLRVCNIARLHVCEDGYL